MHNPKQKVFSSIYCRFAFVFEICRQQKNPEAFSFEISETVKNSFVYGNDLQTTRWILNVADMFYFNFLTFKGKAGLGKHFLGDVA